MKWFNLKSIFFWNSILKWFITKNNVLKTFFSQRKLKCNSLISVCPILFINCEIISVDNFETFWLNYINKWPTFQIYALFFHLCFLQAILMLVMILFRCFKTAADIFALVLSKCIMSDAKQPGIFSDIQNFWIISNLSRIFFWVQPSYKRNISI